jgi:hypothetical protein
MRRTRELFAVVAAVVSLVAGCDDGRYDSAPGGAELKPAFGARVTDGQLRIWTGSECVGVTRFTLYFSPPDTRLVLEAASDQGVDVEYLALGGPYPAGLAVAEPLPADFDWRTAQEMRISVDSPTNGWGTTTELAEVVDKSAEHSDDTYWFEGVGWLNPAQVAEQDGRTFLATCTLEAKK